MARHAQIQTPDSASQYVPIREFSGALTISSQATKYGQRSCGVMPRGYSMRGGRVLTTDNYECTWDLYKSVPSLNYEGKTVFDGPWRDGGPQASPSHWHSAVEFKRYPLRFVLEFSRIETLAGVKRTISNQYDSLVLPLQTWLEAQGARRTMDCKVTDVDHKAEDDKFVATGIRCQRQAIAAAGRSE
jgi:myosin-crossreactive antigen